MCLAQRRALPDLFTTLLPGPLPAHVPSRFSPLRRQVGPVREERRCETFTFDYLFLIKCLGLLSERAREVLDLYNKSYGSTIRVRIIVVVALASGVVQLDPLTSNATAVELLHSLVAGASGERFDLTHVLDEAAGKRPRSCLRRMSPRDLVMLAVVA